MIQQDYLAHPKRKSLISISAFIASPVLCETRDIENMHALVIKHYSFSPQKLNKQEINQKSTELDSFWKLVKSNHEIALPKLREELTMADNPAFFYFDGSKLLLSLSKDRGDKELAISAIARCDLRDLDPRSYMATINKLAMEGIDTSSAAFLVLDHPDFKVVIPEHALILDQDYSLIYMLFPLPENVFYEKALMRIEKEKDIKDRKSLILLLWYTVTEAGDEMIRKIAKNDAEPQEVRDYANELLKESDRHVNLPVSKVEELKKQHEYVLCLRKIAPAFTGLKSVKDISKDDIETMKKYLQCLWSSGINMKKGIVTDIAKDVTTPQELREFAENLIKGKEVDGGTALSERTVLPDSIGELRNQRQMVLSILSDGALQEFERLSILIRWKQAKK